MRIATRAVGLCIFGILVAAPSARALDQIIRPFQSIRSMGMGGLVTTTGIWEENFYGNPARVTANYKFRIQLPDPSVVSTLGTLNQINNVLSNLNNLLATIGNTAGTHLHARVQMAFPGVYFRIGQRAHMAVALLTSVQLDADVRNSYQIVPQTINDIGLAATFGYRLLAQGELSVGATVRGAYRLSSSDTFTFLSLLQGASLSPLANGGDGAHVDFDLGASYVLPHPWLGFQVHAGAHVQNILGGQYTNLPIRLLNTGNAPTSQPRRMGVGLALKRPNFGPFRYALWGLEFNNLGLDGNGLTLGGSLFRHIHLGWESRWRRVTVRAGVNQGYLAAGLGFDLWALDLDLATTGEELSLNAGGYEDRRFAVRLGFKI